MEGIEKKEEAMSQEAIKEQKDKMRIMMKEKRRLLPSDYCQEADKRIRDRLENLSVYKETEAIFCYVSTEEEIDTRVFLQNALRDGKRVAVPRCEKRGIMEAVEIQGMEDLRPGFHGILEPKEGCPVIPPKQLELCVIPCLAGSRSGGRLGYGGGYYDRYLPLTDAVKVLLCREELLCGEVPLEPHDCPADMLITEKQVIFY